MTTIPTEEYYRLVADSGRLHQIEGGQIPELKLALALIILMVALVVWLLINLHAEHNENEVLHKLIEDLHKEENNGSEKT